jgi:hypothetical protein
LFWSRPLKQHNRGDHSAAREQAERQGEGGSHGRRDRHIVAGYTKGITLSEGSQASPVCPSDKGSVKMTLGFNHLPSYMKNLLDDKKKFTNTLKNYFLVNSFNSLKEF